MKTIDNPGLKDKFIKQFHIRDCFDSMSDLSFELVSFSRDECIIREGELTGCLFFLLLGRVKCYSGGFKKDAGSFYMDRGLLGAEELAAKRAPSGSVWAMQEVLCLKLSYEAVETAEKLRNDNGFLRYLSFQLANKLFLADKGSALGEPEKPREERLYEYLRLTAKDGRVSHSLGEISRVMGISYRHLIRMMNGLCDEGRLRRGKNKGIYFIV